MTEESPFKGLASRFKTVTVSGDKIKVHPRVQDAELFMTIKKETGSEDASKITTIIFGMVKRANQQENDEDIKSHIASHYGEWIKVISVVYGFATAEEFEKVRKKTIGQ